MLEDLKKRLETNLFIGFDGNDDSSGRIAEKLMFNCSILEEKFNNVKTFEEEDDEGDDVAAGGNKSGSSNGTSRIICITS